MAGFVRKLTAIFVLNSQLVSWMPKKFQTVCRIFKKTKRHRVEIAALREKNRSEVRRKLKKSHVQTSLCKTREYDDDDGTMFSTRGKELKSEALKD